MFTSHNINCEQTKEMEELKQYKRTDKYNVQTLKGIIKADSKVT